MDGICSLHVELFHTVDRLTYHVQHTTFDLIACGHLNGRTQRHGFQPSLQAVGIVHGHTAHGVLTNVLLHLDNQLSALAAVYTQRLVNLGQHLLCIQSLRVEIDVNDGADDLADASCNL